MIFQKDTNTQDHLTITAASFTHCSVTETDILSKASIHNWEINIFAEFILYKHAVTFQCNPFVYSM